MSATKELASPARGLSYLMNVPKNEHYAHLENTFDYRAVHRRHPFGLSEPEVDRTDDRPRILYVGADSPDMTVQVFLAHIRETAGDREDNRITKLRVIQSPAPGYNRGQYHVFFEVWIGCQAIISGETTNFSGAGGTARAQLEDVFSLLEKTYNLKAERKLMPSLAPLGLLRQPQY